MFFYIQLYTIKCIRNMLIINSVAIGLKVEQSYVSVYISQTYDHSCLFVYMKSI